MNLHPQTTGSLYPHAGICRITKQLLPPKLFIHMRLSLSSFIAFILLPSHCEVFPAAKLSSCFSDLLLFPVQVSTLIANMAPVTRRASAERTTKHNEDSGIKKERKDRPSPLKSAMRDGVEEPRRARQVTFNTEDPDNKVKIHHPATPHPKPKHGKNGSSSPRIDHSKRKEREKLLKRADAARDKRNKAISELFTPPQSPARKSPQRKSPFEEAEIIESEEQSEELEEDDAEQAPEKEEGEQLGETQPPTKLISRKLSQKDIDIVFDDIPVGVKMPASIDTIYENPSVDIKMEEICTAFDFLKSQIQLHCRQYYSYAREKDQKIPSYTYLSVKHPELFRYIRYVADGSQYGWDKLLRIGTQRENLVYGIISRALIAYVFDAELFGAHPEHGEQLLEMCREYLNYDAFVRNIHRAEIITSILLEDNKDNHLNLGEKNYRYFLHAVHDLAFRIDAMLCCLQLSSETSSMGDVRQSLREILHTAVKLHLAIRLAGCDGTVYRFEHAPKNTHWDSTTMNCINQRKMDLTSHHGDETLVKIACFPAVYATVPSGPTLENFADPDFVKGWQRNADEEGSKPEITTYPITLADVVLEYTPHDREGFMTLPQTMAREQMAMSDLQFKNLTGLSRGSLSTRKRIFKIAKRAYASTKPIVRELARIAALSAIVVGGPFVIYSFFEFAIYGTGWYWEHTKWQNRQQIKFSRKLREVFRGIIGQEPSVSTLLKRAASATKLTATRWAGTARENESRIRASMSRMINSNSRISKATRAGFGMGTRTSTLTLGPARTETPVVVPAKGGANMMAARTTPPA